MCYSMPAVEYTKSFITSVVVGKDVVPRIGLHQLESLRADLINTIKRSKDPKVCAILRPNTIYHVRGITKQVGTSLTIELHLVCNPTNDWLFWHMCFVWNIKYQSVNSFKNCSFKITRYIIAEAWKSMHDNLAYTSLETDCGGCFTEVLLIWKVKVSWFCEWKLQIL